MRSSLVLNQVFGRKLRLEELSVGLKFISTQDLKRFQPAVVRALACKAQHYDPKNKHSHKSRRK